MAAGYAVQRVRCRCSFQVEPVAEAMGALTAETTALVDQPDRTAPCPEAPPVRFRTSGGTRRALAALLRHLRSSDLIAGEEGAMVLLLEALRDLHVIAAPETLPGIRKPATRAELLARIARAREYIEDVHGSHCTLERLAAIACLSKFHFLRVFRAVTGETPASYARRRRLERAGPGYRAVANR
ncbi:MAG: helix-turn-helix transcriptional regulator, partial [Gammaproteobacteria bacterium]|nr:helix-turn-helix transcriptional regulator [Gammaproteobacteria bacterium]